MALLASPELRNEDEVVVSVSTRSAVIRNARCSWLRLAENSRASVCPISSFRNASLEWRSTRSENFWKSFENRPSKRRVARVIDLSLPSSVPIDPLRSLCLFFRSDEPTIPRDFTRKLTCNKTFIF